MKNSKKEISSKQSEELLKTLKARFEKNMVRHKGVEWIKIEAKLKVNSQKLWSLLKMEETGGEPDVVSYDEKKGEYIFYDCSPESPKNSACGMAEEMGIELLSEEQYRDLQKFGNFDTKTSSWIKTPADIRDLGGAVFADFRYGKVFIYHNGAESYYAGRAFRGLLRV